MIRTIVRFPDGSQEEFHIEKVAVQNPGIILLVGKTDEDLIGIFPIVGPQAVSVWHPDGPNKVQLADGPLIK